MLLLYVSSRQNIGTLTYISLICSQKDVDKALVPTRVRTIECRVVEVSMGPTHTAVLKETGQVRGEGGGKS